MAHPPELNATVVHRTQVNPRLIILRVAPDGWELPDFKPGQYVTLGIPGSAARLVGTEPEEVDPQPDKLILRAYSIASSSKAKEYLEVYVNLVSDGTFTPRLFALAEGDRLWLKKRIQGMFTLDDVADDKQIIMVATGTGLAPYMSMLRTDPESHSSRRYAVLLGARHIRDLGYHQEMVELSERRSNLLYLPILSRPEGDWPGPVGHVQELWRQGHLERAWGGIPSAANTHIFLCGNPAMIAEMLQLAEEAGFKRHLRRDPGNVHIEEYW
jgi:ferredoxin--NADP+ reductase